MAEISTKDVNIGETVGYAAQSIGEPNSAHDEDLPYRRYCKPESGADHLNQN
jgi:hypothetical protein